MNRSIPFFSIIIPTFNSSKSVGDCLDSILNQSCQDFEILIIDGCSTDNTISIVKNKFLQNSSKFFLSSKTDSGVYDAMNQGIKLATGKWLYFLGSDDTFVDYKVLQDIQIALSKTTSKIVYGNVWIVGNPGWAKDGQIYAGKFSFQRLLIKNICHQSIFYRKNFLLKNNLRFDLRYPVSSDWDFNIRCRQLTKFKYINRVIAYFSAGGISSVQVDSFSKIIKDKYKDLFRPLWISMIFSIIKLLTLRVKKNILNKLK